MAHTLEYSVLDVFAETPLTGNPLAVFHDARSLSTAQMQAIARETNLSETTFILPAEDPQSEVTDGVRVRIFTVQEELPFAGHPTLGTATWLHWHHPALRGAADVKLRLDAGVIPVSFQSPAPGETGIFATMQQNDPVFGATFDPSEIAAVTGVPLQDLLPGYAPQVVSTANPFCIVPLRSVAALQRLEIPQKESTAWLRDHATRWLYCIAPTADPHLWHARMQWSAGEDPATGSAAGPCIAWLVRNGLVSAGTSITLSQGNEIFRPSLITAQASLNGTEVREVRVGGRTILVANGRLFL